MTVFALRTPRARAFVAVEAIADRCGEPESGISQHGGRAALCAPLTLGLRARSHLGHDAMVNWMVSDGL